MVKFSYAPVEDVVPPRKSKAPSERARTRAIYQEMLISALAEGRALVVHLDPGDKALTTKQRLRRVATALHLDVKIRRRGETVVAWTPTEES